MSSRGGSAWNGEEGRNRRAAGGCHQALPCTAPLPQPQPTCTLFEEAVSSSGFASD